MSDAGFRVAAATWARDEAALRAVREAVFLVEQRTPEDEEWDEFDAVSHHALATDAQGRPIGTGRLTPGGRIGRMAVLAGWRGRGVGAAILAGLIERARALRLPALEMHAQCHAIGFYERFGFAAHGDTFDECGIPHRRMRLDLAPPPARADAPPTAVGSREQALATVGRLLAQARHELAICTRDLDPALLDLPQPLEALKRIALSGRRARIRILVQEPRRALADGHRLIALAQRLPSAIALRAPVEEIDQRYPSAFLLNDALGYYFRPLGHRFEGEAAERAPGRHSQLATQFDQAWERALPAAELRALAF